MPAHVGTVDVCLRSILSEHMSRAVGDPGAFGGSQVVLPATVARIYVVLFLEHEPVVGDERRVQSGARGRSRRWRGIEVGLGQGKSAAD
eukprot:8404851-Pyramimonas_sp.AAC.1